MTQRTAATCLALVLAALVAGPAGADPLTLRVQPRTQPLFLQHAWRVAGNPNVTPDNPMGVVGWDGPPDDVPSVSADAGPMPPGSIANAPVEGFGYGVD
ncbi:hypothetical protein MKK69_03980 [Methylobacterium sp. J-026]|uniref:hypothetical protein n=1 Tax=Methylobacterium sp. J-026 TaxID=2836624 RepID=UPI001FB8AB69|nr:hypothetical protein [Methylobacterium sp. J-026]MCJ2133231.1 hypothetical protein [Methylobacterium sp. J-026]